MIALQKTAPAFGLEWRDIPTPNHARPGEVIVAVTAAGVCGSDVHIYEWSGGYDFLTQAMPVTIGHEFAGMVAAIGSGVTGLRVGQAVVVIPSVECGVCEHCTEGRLDDCRDRRGIGMQRDGGFAQFAQVPAQNCLTLPDGFDPGIAALCEPLSIALSAIETGGVEHGDTVLVLGPGSIGQGIALLAARRGAEVVVAGYDDAERLACVRALGVSRTLDLKDQPASDAPAMIGRDAFDIVIDAAGVQSAVDTGARLLRPSGVMVICGIHAGRVQFDGASFVRMRHQIRGTYRASRRAWADVLAFVVANEVALAPMVTHRLALPDALRAFEMAKAKIGGKILLIPQAPPIDSR